MGQARHARRSGRRRETVGEHGSAVGHSQRIERQMQFGAEVEGHLVWALPLDHALVLVEDGPAECTE
jgi:hypothetical protein